MASTMGHVRFFGFTATLLGLALRCACAHADVIAVVSSNSPITTLSRNQVADIFLGKTSRLPDGTPVVPLDQVEGSSPRNEFYTAMTGKSAAQMKAYWSKIIFTGRGRPPREVDSNGEVKKSLAANPNAIGYIDKGATDASVRAISITP